MCISIIRKYWYIRKLDRLAFPEKPIPIKVVLRRRGRGPAGYWNDVKNRGQEPTKEWYEVVIIAKKGSDFNIAIHEVRHRIQQYYPKMPLFTRNKLIEMNKRNPEKALQIALDFLEAVERQKRKVLSEEEQDAVIVATLIEQRYKAGCNIEAVSQLIKQAP